MDASDQAFARLLGALERGGELAFDGLTARKVQERGEIVTDPARAIPNHLIVDVERHAAACGDSYRPGLPLAAYVEYTQTATFNIQTNELHVEGDRNSPGGQLHFDATALAEAFVDQLFFTTEKMPDGTVCCEEATLQMRSIVANRDAVERFGREIAAKIDLGVTAREDLETYCGPADAQAKLAELREATQQACVDAALRSWEAFKEDCE